jgi:hypothetical protein
LTLTENIPVISLVLYVFDTEYIDLIKGMSLPFAVVRNRYRDAIASPRTCEDEGLNLGLKSLFVELQTD